MHLVSQTLHSTVRYTKLRVGYRVDKWKSGYVHRTVCAPKKCPKLPFLIQLNLTETLDDDEKHTNTDWGLQSNILIQSE